MVTAKVFKKLTVIDFVVLNPRWQYNAFYWKKNHTTEKNSPMVIFLLWCINQHQRQEAKERYVIHFHRQCWSEWSSKPTIQRLEHMSENPWEKGICFWLVISNQKVDMKHHFIIGYHPRMKMKLSKHIANECKCSVAKHYQSKHRYFAKYWHIL